MKFCLLTSSYPQFPQESINAGVFVREFALELRKQGHRVTLFTPAKAQPIEADAGLEVHAFPWSGKELVLTRLNPQHPLDALRLMHLWWAGSRDIVRWGTEQQFDRLLAFWAIPSGWFAYRLHRSSAIPYDVWVLGSDIWKRRQYPLGNRIVKQVLQNAATVFADGNDLVQECQAIAGRPASLLRSVRRLPLAFPPVQLESGVCHFVFVGRWDKVKGLDVFVNAFLGLQGQIPCRAHIFGEGPQAKWLLQRLKESHAAHVHVYGLVSPEVLSGYLRACDFAVISSRQESLPVVFFDAMQAGLPVIVSDVGDLRSFVEKYHVGLVVPPDNIQALQQAMLKAAATGKSQWERSCKDLGATLNPAHMVTEYLEKISPHPITAPSTDPLNKHANLLEGPLHEK